MTKREFQVGEKVRCFEANGFEDGVVTEVKQDCVFVKHSDRSHLGIAGWHPYQVRRLKPKPQKAQQRVTKYYVPESLPGANDDFYVQNYNMDSRAICLMEFFEFEVPVSREALAAAWDKAHDNITGSGIMSENFGKFCKALGLPEAKS